MLTDNLQGSYHPNDDIRNLYVGHIPYIDGLAHTQDGEIPLQLRGEILLYGQKDGEGNFRVEHLRRLILFGAQPDPPNPPEQDPIGALSLGAQLFNTPVEIEENTIKQLRMTFHYRLLSSEEPIYPPREEIEAHLSWEGIEQIGDNAFQLYNVMFTTGELITPQAGYISGIKIVEDEDKPFNIDIHLAGTAEPRGRPKNSVPGHCNPPPTPCPTGAPPIPIRHLPIKFINLSHQEDVDDLCKDQITHLNENDEEEAISLVWRQKAAMDLTVHPNVLYSDVGTGIVDNSAIKAERDFFGDFSNPLWVNILPYRSSDHVDVFIVDEVSVGGGAGGGITYGRGTAEAVIILSRSAMANNPRLLAHELIHIFGLDDLDGSGPHGSWGSIAEAGTPSPKENTLFNFRFVLACTCDSGELTCCCNTIPFCTTAATSCFQFDP